MRHTERLPHIFGRAAVLAIGVILSLTSCQEEEKETKERADRKETKETVTHDGEDKTDRLNNEEKIEPSQEQDESLEEETAAASEFEGIGVGDFITFGHYEQDQNSENGEEPIEWIVLDQNEDQWLIISRYVLDGMVYHTMETEVTWAKCSLRQWLNDDFLDAAFEEEEQDRILQKSIANPGSRSFWNSPYGIELGVNIWGNPIDDVREWGVKDENPTSDKVFVLSYEEALTYFSSNEERRCTATLYAAGRGQEGVVYVKNPPAAWWLRTPGLDLTYAMYVEGEGVLRYNFVNSEMVYGVRPAMWITVSQN